LKRLVQKGDGEAGGGQAAPSTNRAPAVSRAAAVLRLLASERSGLGVTEISRRVGLVPSTCFHVLRALVEEGFVAFDSTDKSYRTGIGLITLVREAQAAIEYPKLVQPYLDELSSTHGVTAIAVELDQRERMVVVAISRSDSLISLHVNVGSRFPALISATGRCIAAARNLSRDQLRKQFDTLRWEKPPRFEEWCAEVERTKIEGVAIDRGNYIRGISILSSLLPGAPDGSTRGIALVGFDHLMAERVLRQIKSNLLRAAKTVGSQFG
jgi:DNA-binding IclR family transcriptional regulator